MPNPPSSSAYWSTNHEYSKEQLLRFHAVNLHHRAQAILSQVNMDPALEPLLQSFITLNNILTLAEDGTVAQMSLHPDDYRDAIRELQQARRDLPDLQNTNAKALIRQTLVNCIYSCIAITSLLKGELHP